MSSDHKPPAPPPLTEEETLHWQSQLEDVAPLAIPQKIQPPTPTVGTVRKQPRHRAPVAPSTLPPQPIERGLLDRIGKEREPIDARIDLHGYTEAEAFAQFSDFILRCHARQMRTVLVITGKGRGGEGRLRRALQHWLELDSIRGYISGYHTARAAHGGEGAWYLRLRQKDKR